MVVRPVEGLLWARPCERPDFVPNSRPRGAKAAGLRYERAFVKYLQPGVIHGQWFEFEDASGLRYCQTDVLYPLSLHLLAVVELKYTLVDSAWDQLLDLYGPVVEAAYNIPCGLVTVFKNFPRSDMGKLALHDNLMDATTFSRDTGTVSLLHWVGQPLIPKPNRRTAGILATIRGRRPTSDNPQSPRRVEAPGSASGG